LGNHDWRLDGNEMKDFTTSSKNGGYWQMPDFNHKVRFGDVEVFMVDTEVWRGDARRRSPPSSEPANWLERELGRSSAAWKIVAGHHPVYSAGSHGGATEMKRELDPIMRKAGANIYFAGHDHSQQHIQWKNVNYIVSGAGSKSPRGRSDDYEDGSLKKYLGETGFAGLKICDKNQATLKLYDHDGREKYKATLRNENPGGGGGGDEPSRRRGGGGDDERRRRRRRRASFVGGEDDEADQLEGRRRRASSLGGEEEEDLEEEEEDMDDKPENPRDKAVCAGVKMTSVDLRCSDDGCIVQTDINSAKESCDDYCAAHGVVCTGAWTNDFEDCGLDVAVTCDSFVIGGSSQVCQCS